MTSPFDVFLQLDQTSLRRVQVKLTYIGPQTEPVPTVAFGTYFSVLQMSSFVPFRTAGVDYVNDELPAVWNFTLDPADVETMIQGLSLIPEVRSGSGDGGYLSLMLVDPADPLNGRAAVGFEALLNEEDADEALAAIEQAVTHQLAADVLYELRTLLF